MINFNKHLKEILYDHDFVVLPRIGAFIASFRIDESGEEAKPFKSFVFNTIILADENNKFFNYILSKETVPLSEIEIQWSEYIGNLKSIVDSNKLLEVAGIGNFVKNTKLDFRIDENVNFYSRDEFVPVDLSLKKDFNQYSNDDLSTKGVSTDSDRPAYSESIINETFASDKETVNEFFDTDTLASKMEAYEDEKNQSESFLEEVYEEEEQTKPFWWWLLPLLLIIVGVLSYWWLNRDSEFNKEDEQGLIINIEDEVGLDVNVDPFAVEDSITIESPLFPLNKEEDDVENEIISKPLQEQTNEVTVSDAAYHVWAGLFRKRINAEKLQKKLIDNDILAKIQKVKNMRRIYVPVKTEKEAREMVKKIEQLTGDKAVYFEVD